MNPLFSPFNPDHQADSADSRILAAMERIYQAFRVLLWNHGKAWSLSPIQVQVIIFLQYHTSETRRISYLAREFNMSKATISETIATLERKGLISREPLPSDSRSHTINLTEKGFEIAGKTSCFANTFFEPLNRLSASDKNNHLESLLEILRHLQLSGVISMDRMCYTCRHFNENHVGEGPYCVYLDKSLEKWDLRIDCPHQAPFRIGISINP
jgi:DNA-binding MarR family transcriptional regulator